MDIIPAATMSCLPAHLSFSKPSPTLGECLSPSTPFQDCMSQKYLSLGKVGDQAGDKKAALILLYFSIAAKIKK